MTEPTLSYIVSEVPEAQAPGGPVALDFALPPNTRTSRFIKNPVMIYADDAREAIGRVDELHVTSNRLRMTVSPDTRSERGGMVRRHLDGGLLRFFELIVEDGEVLAVSAAPVPHGPMPGEERATRSHSPRSCPNCRDDEACEEHRSDARDDEWPTCATPGTLRHVMLKRGMAMHRLDAEADQPICDCPPGDGVAVCTCFDPKKFDDSRFRPVPSWDPTGTATCPVSPNRRSDMTTKREQDERDRAQARADMAARENMPDDRAARAAMLERNRLAASRPLGKQASAPSPRRSDATDKRHDANEPADVRARREMLERNRRMGTDPLGGGGGEAA